MPTRKRVTQQRVPAIPVGLKDYSERSYSRICSPSQSLKYFPPSFSVATSPSCPVLEDSADGQTSPLRFVRIPAPRLKTASNRSCCTSLVLHGGSSGRSSGRLLAEGKGRTMDQPSWMQSSDVGVTSAADTNRGTTAERVTGGSENA